MTTITKRVSADIAEGTTKRVNYFDSFTVQSIDKWGGTWGLTWCMKWGGLLNTEPTTPALDATNRVDASALTENTTKRVTI